MQTQPLSRSFLPAWILFSLSLAAQSQGPAGNRPAGSLTAVDRGPHYTTWEHVVPVAGPDGQLTSVTQTYVQLESGLNYQDAKGRWQESGAEIELVPGGAQFIRGRHQVAFSAELNEAGAVQVRTAEGQVLKTRVLGLAYYDLRSGRSVLIAALQDSTGELMPNHQQIIYPDAFKDVAADVRYTVTRSSFEQDIVLREQLPDPAQYGLSPDSVLQVLTEFFDPPAPVEEIQAQKDAADAAVKKHLPLGSVTPAVVGDRLTFGSLSVIPGRAFLLNEADPGVPIIRTWKRLEGQQFLIESVPVNLIQTELGRLPARPIRHAMRSGWDLRKYVQSSRPAKQRPTASAGAMRRATGYAAVRPGFVLDYSTITGTITNLTFAGNATYYVTGPVSLYGTTTIEAGTVVKFANTNGAQCSVAGPVTCQTGFYTPAVFTAKDDNSVGATISGSSGNPSGGYAATALLIQNNTSDLRNLRIAWATNAVMYSVGSGSPQYLTHVQVLNCSYGVRCQSPVFWVRNGLFNNVQTVFATGSAGVTGNCEHLTVDAANYFNGTVGLTLYVTNSLLVSVTNMGSYSGLGNAVDNTAAFQTAGAGTHYLAVGRGHQNAGAGNLSSRLQTDFRNFTTCPPLLYSNVTVNVNTTWSPQAGRDTSATPDRGYHYPALDYLISRVTVNAGTLLLTNGVAVGCHSSSGITTSGSGVLVSEGSPGQLNRLTTAHSVQEQCLTLLASPMLLGAGGVSLNLRFTEASMVNGSGSFLSTMFNNPVNLRDSQFRNFSWTFYNCSGPGYQSMQVNMTNNLFERCALSPSQSYSGTPCYLSLLLHNNLFSSTSLTLYHYGNYYGAWEIYDNLFDTSTISYTEQSTNYLTAFGYNGFINTTENWVSGTNKKNLARDFSNGPLGPYYYPTTGATNSLATLINADTVRTPAGVGLYHFTTKVSLDKELATPLDIGFHYVATDASGNPTDSDGDGIADYLEDRNGNGNYDPLLGESNWLQSGNGTTGVPGLQVFTLLKP
jgi:hypothetical protein